MPPGEDKEPGLPRSGLPPCRPPHRSHSRGAGGVRLGRYGTTPASRHPGGPTFLENRTRLCWSEHGPRPQPGPSRKPSCVGVTQIPVPACATVGVPAGLRWPLGLALSSRHSCGTPQHWQSDPWDPQDWTLTPEPWPTGTLHQLGPSPQPRAEHGSRRAPDPAVTGARGRRRLPPGAPGRGSRGLVDF